MYCGLCEYFNEHIIVEDNQSYKETKCIISRETNDVLPFTKCCNKFSKSKNIESENWRNDTDKLWWESCYDNDDCHDCEHYYKNELSICKICEDNNKWKSYEY